MEEDIKQLPNPFPTEENPATLKNAQGIVFILLYYKQDYVVAKWLGHLNADDMVNAANSYLELIKQHPNPKLLNDKTEATGDWQEVNDWLEFEWMPAAAKAGLKCMVHVYLPDMLTSYSQHDLFSRAIPNMKLAEFTDLEAAETWLSQCIID